MGNPVSKQHIRIQELFDLSYVQNLQDDFARLSNLTIVMIDTEGGHITRASNGHGFCAAMAGNPAGWAKCSVSNQQMVAELKKTGQAVQRTCPHSGLLTAAVPIHFKDTLLAAWLIGEVRTREPDDALLERTAQDIGEDPEVLKQRVYALPPMDPAQFDIQFSFLKTLGDSMIMMGKARQEAEDTSKQLLNATQELDSTAKMMRRFIDSTDVGFYICDYNTGELLMVNNHYLEMAGASQEDVIGAPCWQLGGPGGDTFCHYCPRNKLLKKDGTPAKPYRWENYNEQFSCWLRITNQAIYWSDGRLAHMVTFWDISSEHAMRDELAHLAFYDRQMGLPNSLKMTQDLDAVKFRSEADRLYYVSFDIVSLRRLNDAYGRPAVDILLSTIMDWMRGQDFPLQQIYRVDGDSFSLMLNDVTVEEATQIAMRIDARFSEAWIVHLGLAEVPMVCKASISVVGALPDRSSESFLTLVERTLDDSRREGIPVIYTDEMEQAAREMLLMEMSLKNAVVNKMEGFSVQYQPIVDPAAGVWHSFEALCRWTSPELGPIPPSVFIREAEQRGLIGAIGAWVLETAVCQCKKWGLDKLDTFLLHVNLSPAQLSDVNLANKVIAILNKYDYPGDKLSLELTESAEMYFDDFIGSVIENLRFRGIQFALDDFGTGYSSFNSLKNLPVTCLKTERAFIENIESDTYMQYFFFVMSELAHAADMKLIAEGVETREQLEIILKNGADYIQGYYFSKPLTAEAAEKRLFNFTHVNPAFYAIQSGPLELNDVLEGKHSYMITPRLFHLMNQCMQILLSEDALDKAFLEVLSLVGDNLGAAQAFIAEKRAPGLFEYSYEWSAPGTEPKRRTFANRQFSDLEQGGWEECLLEKGLVVTSDVSTLPARLKDTLADTGIRSLALLPLLDGRELIGIVQFSCHRFREWLPEEIMMLRNLSMTMASSLHREQMRSEIEQKGAIFTDVMNHMGPLMYISDVDTDEILWANKAMKASFDQDEPLEGRKCYEVLYDNPQRCVFCKVDALINNPAIRQYHWEYHNERRNRDFMVYDSIVEWEGGKKAHLQYSIDTTEAKDTQRKLEYYSSIDDLTGTLNRKSLYSAMEALLNDAQEGGRPLTVVFIDFDNLKTANKAYGHIFGDKLLSSMVAAVRTAVRRGDIIGRFGYDEFVLIMPGCTQAQARERVMAARDRLKGRRFAPSTHSYTFSFGTAASDEISCDSMAHYVKALIGLAESRMPKGDERAQDT